MKSFSLSFALALFILFGITHPSRAQTGRASFVIANQQSVSLGEVTIAAKSGNYYATVPGNSTDTVALSPDTAAISVTINGQTVPAGVNAILTLAGGKQVAVLWSALNEILIIDESDLG